MSKNHHPKRSDVKDNATPENNIVAGNVASPVIIQEKKPTPFKTVGTCRKSKSGNAISIKLISENRFLHISIRDVELILLDENNSTVANVREYEKLEKVNGVV
jgi:hypothetical protein